MRFREIFPQRRVFFAVVHVQSTEQALQNTDIARAGGADGVFLINHHISEKDLIAAYWEVRRAHLDWWIGLNILGASPSHAFAAIPNSASGLWTDHAGVSDASSLGAEASNMIRSIRKSWQGLYFGGVAFKGQEPVADPAKAARRAMLFMDVITTSGTATGLPPAVAKITAMKSAIGLFPLAIASGMTPENVHNYPQADAFLVATGISESFTRLDQTRVRAFREAIQIC